MPSSSVWEEDLAALLDYLRPLSRLAVSFSGGVDSALLLAAGVQAVGCENVYAFTVSSPLYPVSEEEESEAFCRSLGVRFRLIETDPLGVPEIVRNDERRCYHCKRYMLSAVLRAAADLRIDNVLEGTNFDDLSGYRPGAPVPGELGALSPLKDLGFTKDRIRALAAELRIPQSTRPSSPCLATRIPYGTPLAPDTLEQIEAGERAISSLGFMGFRLRHHGELARIELRPEDFPKALERKDAIVSALLALSYRFVTLDLSGYRQGCFDAPYLAGEERG